MTALPPVQPSIALIPERTRAEGPVTRAVRRRLALGHAAIASAGLALWLLGEPFWRGFGLGLLFPGAGFLAGLGSEATLLTAVAGLLLSLMLFGLAFVAWFGAGNLLAPLLIRLGTAVVAGLLAPPAAGSGAPLLALGAMAAVLVARRWQGRRRLAQQQADRARRNACLHVLAQERGVDLARSETRPLDDDALGLLRHVLDRSLQPVGRFDGFQWADQFQFGALRYAVCGMGYALAGIQYGATPAFTGYLSEAQRRLHQKMLDHRNWKYWAWENAWGNLALDPNPVHHRDNVMYHGWFMAMLGEYISNTGDGRYNEQPLVLRHPGGREWRYRFSEVCEILYRSHLKSPFTLFPCEPNWIYPMCNNFSAIALKIHDRLCGTHWFAELEARYRRQFDEEFCTVDGRVLAIRSAFTGITLPMLTSAMADSVTAHFQHGTFPDLARRAWEIARMDFIRLSERGVEIQTRGWDKLDTGNYRPSMITTYAQIGTTAAEMGDEEVARRLRQRVRAEFQWDDEDGAVRLRGASSQAHAVALTLFSSHANLRRNLHQRGPDPAHHEGPQLAEAPYPQVLVAHAVSDGRALSLELCPGRRQDAGEPLRLGLRRLRPNGRYRLGDGRRLVADARGEASFTLALGGRCRIEITPED